MDIEGEHLDVVERVVISPVAGVFVPLDGAVGAVEAGTTIGLVRAGDEHIPVLSPFRGRVIDVVAMAGERLLAQQRVAWMRAA
jgi:hypothetical protein